MKNGYTWDEIFKALDFLEQYDNQDIDVIAPCPPEQYRNKFCASYLCKQCRMQFALESAENNELS